MERTTNQQDHTIKVKCINNKMNLTHPESNELTRLTEGKLYDGISYQIGINVINDEGYRETFVHERFIKMREINLKKLGI